MSRDTPLVDLLADTWTRTTGVVTGLDEAGWARPTRTALWDVKALLLHLLLDAQRTLVALASPATGPPDVDATSYWRGFRPDRGDGGAAHGAWVARSAAAHEHGSGVLGRWEETAGAALRALRSAEVDALVGTQGHVLTAADLTSTLVVEATVHLLDLTLEVAGEPSAAALAHTRGVLEALHDSPLPPAWDDRTAVLRGTGREPLTDQDRSTLDPAAFPLLG